jgi:SpoVK/Ycf46/Vps4 family AAA+-type ATPase
MTRADLLCDIIKYGLNGDQKKLHQSIEAICAEERGKQHRVLADRIEKLLIASDNSKHSKDTFRIPRALNAGNNAKSFLTETSPEKRLSDLILPDHVSSICDEFIEEQLRADLLRSFGLEPRHRLLLVGAPGNGKTSLAEALADALMLPIFTVRYDQIIGSYLGETASRLAKLFDYVRTQPCVLFFDEFETLGKERGDTHETGEIKRVVSSLLLQVDSLPSYVIIIAATNHDALLDKAAWRRFQIKLELPAPTRAGLEKWYALFERSNDFSFGLTPGTLAKRTLGCSYSDAEEIANSIYRQYVLNMPLDTAKPITERILSHWSKQRKQSKNLTVGGEA